MKQLGINVRHRIEPAVTPDNILSLHIPIDQQGENAADILAVLALEKAFQILRPCHFIAVVTLVIAENTVHGKACAHKGRESIEVRLPCDLHEQIDHTPGQIIHVTAIVSPICLQIEQVYAAGLRRLEVFFIPNG